jgi:hypothetical protein
MRRKLARGSSTWLAALIVACTSHTAPRSTPAPKGSPSHDERDAGRTLYEPVTLPTIPVGFDAYRAWAELPSLRIGARSYMRSTYDRGGGNEEADASHFLRSEADDFNVTLDVVGPGVLYFVRTNHWHGSPWHYVIDGDDLVVTETSTADPDHPAQGSVLQPELAFPSPLAVTWPITKGADLDWVPIPFARSFTLGYGRTHYGTGYYIYQSFPEGASNLSHPVTAFEPVAPPADVVELLARAGQDIAASGDGVDTLMGQLDVAAGASAELATLSGRRVLRALKLRVSREQALAASNARLRISWDDRSEPSVDAPLGLFFGAGVLYNREDKEWLVRGLLINVRFAAGQVELASYFPMPFFSQARIELIAGDAPLAGVHYELRSTALDEQAAPVGYFHATYRDHGVPTIGQDLVILDTTTTEGGGDFCGSFNGMSWTFSDRADLTTLEGDPRFFFDDSQSPQAYGTGTEEWGGGGDYWGGENMSLPLAGHPAGAPSLSAAHDATDQIESAYRLLVADMMPFGKNARIQLEHGAVDDSSEHYTSVAYWYGAPGACLTLSDTLDVGDETDERAHEYVSSSASDVEIVRSRYEWGPDHSGDTVLFPEQSETGRHMTGTSEFTLRLDPNNLGVMLRRTLDYAFPDQRAEVFVADIAKGAHFERAGTWYLAGSNSCVFSDPFGELDPPAPFVETSNRRLRQDEFLIRPELTHGRRQVRMRIVFSPRAKPLLPGRALPALAWSELKYEAYSWRLPGLQ